MSEKNSHDLDVDLTNYDDAIAHMRMLADRTVEITKLSTKTKEAAVHSLTKRYRFRTWLKRLCRGDKVPDSFSMYRRLCIALEEAVREQQEMLARDQNILRHIRVRDAIDLSSSDLADRRLAKSARAN